jgi:hypothetical protein
MVLGSHVVDGSSDCRCHTRLHILAEAKKAAPAMSVVYVNEVKGSIDGGRGV